MEPERARQLLGEEKARLEQLLADRSEAAEQDRAAGDESARFSDGAESLTAEAGDDAVIGGIEARLGAISRAEERLAAGTYGRSVRSGAPIPDERLEADPAAELTVEEATQAT